LGRKIQIGVGLETAHRRERVWFRAPAQERTEVDGRAVGRREEFGEKNVKNDGY